MSLNCKFIQTEMSLKLKYLNGLNRLNGPKRLTRLNKLNWLKSLQFLKTLNSASIGCISILFLSWSSVVAWQEHRFACACAMYQLLDIPVDWPALQLMMHVSYRKVPRRVGALWSGQGQACCSWPVTNGWWILMSEQ